MSLIYDIAQCFCCTDRWWSWKLVRLGYRSQQVGKPRHHQLWRHRWRHCVHSPMTVTCWYPRAPHSDTHTHTHRDWLTDSHTEITNNSTRGNTASCDPFKKLTTNYWTTVTLNQCALSVTLTFHLWTRHQSGCFGHTWSRQLCSSLSTTAATCKL